MVRAAIILSPDESGLRRAFGIPAARRCALVAMGLGLDAVHVLGRDESLRPALSDLLPADAFHTISDVREFGRMAGTLGLAEGDRVLVMHAGHPIDRWSLRQLLGAEDQGANGAAPVCIATAGDLPSVFRALWSYGKPEAAESWLLDALGRSTEATDSFLSRRIHRPISRFITRRLVRTAATPNMVTIFNIAVGLAGAFFLAKGVYALQVLGSLFFLLSTILDGVDGELARLTLKESVLGHYLDIVGDNVVHVAIFFGIALGLYRSAADPVYLHALWFLLCGFVLCALAVHRLMGHGPEKPKAGQASWLESLLVNRDFAYIVVLAALVHRLSWFLFGAAAGVYAVALTFFAVGFTKKRAAIDPTAK
jgi:phosphatidylglycerophosphate synthase